MSRCLQGWRCLLRSRPELLMTGSNWEVEDGAEPSLVNNSSSTSSLFRTMSIGLVGPTARFAWGWLNRDARRSTVRRFPTKPRTSVRDDVVQRRLRPVPKPDAVGLDGPLQGPVRTARCTGSHPGEDARPSAQRLRSELGPPPRRFETAPSWTFCAFPVAGSEWLAPLQTATPSR